MFLSAKKIVFLHVMQVWAPVQWELQNLETVLKAVRPDLIVTNTFC